MKEIINKLLKNTKKYDSRPVYSAQVSKAACRLVVEFDSGIEYRYPNDGLSSEMVPLNPFLYKNGKQKINIKIYPETTELFIPTHAVANINFFYASDIDFEFPEYIKIAEFVIPEEILKAKLPFFQSTIEIEVLLPYNLKDELDRSVDLILLPDIEELVVDKYNQIREVIIKRDQRAYNNLNYHYSLTFYNTIYHTSEKDIQEGETAPLMTMWNGLKNREITPIEDYEMKFYSNNKIVALWQKQNMYPIISATGYVENASSPNGIKDFYIPDFLFLYLPDKSKGLEIW